MLFHHSFAYLQPGDLVRSGSWGRLLRGYGGQHSLFFRETLWELVRQREFPTLPSRLDASFYYDTEDAARIGMRGGEAGRAPNLYAIELSLPNALIHRADLDLWERAWNDVHQPAEAEDIARRYWSGEMPTGRVECLTESDLRIVRVIERSRPRA